MKLNQCHTNHLIGNTHIHEREHEMGYVDMISNTSGMVANVNSI